MIVAGVGQLRSCPKSVVFQNLENCQAVKRNASVGSLVGKDGLESTVGFTAMHFFAEPELMRLTNEVGFSLCYARLHPEIKPICKTIKPSK